MMKLLALPILLTFAGSAGAESPAKGASRIEISVTKRGFDPDNIKIPANRPVLLVFTRKTEQTCAKSVVLTLGDGQRFDRELPLDKPVEIAATFSKAGRLSYACGMDMMKGIITVE